MIDVSVPDSYPLYSLMGLDSYGIDCEMYFETMRSFPALISIDLGQSIKALSEFTADGAAELSKLIESCLLVVNMSEELKAHVDEINAASLIGIIMASRWNTDDISSKDYEEISSDLKEKYSSTAYSAIGKIINTFCQHEIPYFENFLPYKFLGISVDTGYAMFSQMSFESFYQHVSRKQL